MDNRQLGDGTPPPKRSGEPDTPASVQSSAMDCSSSTNSRSTPSPGRTPAQVRTVSNGSGQPAQLIQNDDDDDYEPPAVIPPEKDDVYRSPLVDVPIRDDGYESRPANPPAQSTSAFTPPVAQPFPAFAPCQFAPYQFVPYQPYFAQMGQYFGDMGQYTRHLGQYFRQIGQFPWPMANGSFGPFFATMPAYQQARAYPTMPQPQVPTPTAGNLWRNFPQSQNTPAPIVGEHSSQLQNNSPAPKQEKSPEALPSPRSPRMMKKDGRHPDPINAPSKESGGVPNPTPAYLKRASQEPVAVEEPRPLLIVIDLNGTLLYRPDKHKPTKYQTRPLASQFIRKCIEKYRVVIWSSTRDENVRIICQKLLSPDLLSRVVAIWGRTKFGLSPSDFKKRTMCYKRLTKLWADPRVAQSYPAGAEGEHGWDQSNTILIDDTPEKARAEPYNAIIVPEYTGEQNEQPRVLECVEQYLETLRYQADVSAYMRVNPFALPEKQTEEKKKRKKRKRKREGSESGEAAQQEQEQAQD